MQFLKFSQRLCATVGVEDGSEGFVGRSRLSCKLPSLPRSWTCEDARSTWLGVAVLCASNG